MKAHVPEVCAVTNGLAVLTMAVLAPGTEIVGDRGSRAAYIADHRVLWSVGWALWSAAALTLLGFYIWWASHLPRGWQPIAAVAVAALAIIGDLSAESLLVGWVPGDIGIAALATFLTGVYANGLYTVAGAWLTLQTRVISGRLRVAAWTMWTTGALLSVFALLHMFIAVAIATVVLFAIFCPWVVFVGRRLR